MAFQRNFGRLQSSPHWKPLEAFAADDTRLELPFGLRVNSTAREDIRQICKYLNLNFRCVGEGSQKKIIALKMDAVREKKQTEETVAAAPRHVANFYKEAMKIVGPKHAIQVNGLFVQEYLGEKAWTLHDEREESAKKRAKKAEGGESGSEEEVKAMLGRFKTVTKEDVLDDLEDDI
mmetsp:Transcript_20624/g.30730  ORF Transcript_20624/g.30730 Transcript_20624/m.30730 type:complete len:177 (-) Transcript_20624:409-939(-)